MLRVGLTGGIASGKSAVAGMFAAHGVPIIDTDVIAREVVRPGTPGLEAVFAAFGDAVKAADGTLDRSALRAIVFADDDQRSLLESILHPLIRAASLAQSAAASGPYQIIVVPLLFESPMRNMMDRILVVDCSAATQLARLQSRDAESASRAERMLAAQASREQRLSIADDIIDNDGDLEQTRRQVDDLHRRYLALSDQHD